MMYLAGSAMSAALVAAAASIPINCFGPEGPATAPGAPAAPPVTGQTVQISVLTYNVHGLPWPLAGGRGAALRAIGRELAARREAGRQPDVVLIQEGFRDEIADLVKVSGYRFWARGPSRSDRAPEPPPGKRSAYRRRVIPWPARDGESSQAAGCTS